MTVFDSIKNKNIDELAEWLDEHCIIDNAPWDKWYNKNYCNKCAPEIGHVIELDRDCEFAWCEIHKKCKYFQDKDDILDDKQIIKMWLESEV